MPETLLVGKLWAAASQDVNRHRLAGVNRLSEETSPYLRQHLDNPVNWYPWGPEAFAEAAERDRPVLLSVGYSSCHWCHVMAHESFEDPETAAVMNRLFVNVKVDREERPDVDAIYMDSVQAMTGRGGWPMTVFMTPDGRPFFGGTYYPDKPRGQMASFKQVMAAIDDAWNNRRSDVYAQADQLVALIDRTARVAVSLGDGGGGGRDGGDGNGGDGGGGDTGLAGKSGFDHDQMLSSAGDAILAGFDPQWGGFGGAPKFPAAMTLTTALRIYHRSKRPEVLRVVRTSLDAMAAGGIYDHLGGGFSRYSVDHRWLVPHFEKMLYDNALLTRAYLHAWLVTGEAQYRQVLDETVGYVLRDLRHPDGGFFSAEDADSEGVEGKFYVWSQAEFTDVVRDAAGAEAAERAAAWWGVTTGGNFEGSNILHRPVRGELIRSEEVEIARRALFTHRQSRVRPGLDDKVLTEWNALMLAALAEVAAATGDSSWREAALANGDFLLHNLQRDDGRWLRSWQAGTQDRPAQARHLAYAQDYAALIDAFTRLGEMSGQARWIAKARDAADGLLDLFWDDERSGVFTTGKDAEALVTRPKDLMDNATPSAQSSAACGLLRLAALTGEARYDEHARRIVETFSVPAVKHPTAFGRALEAVDLASGGVTEIAVVGDRADLAEAVQSRYTPSAVLAWGEPYDSALWRDRPEGFAYVCRDFTCQSPVSTPDELIALLEQDNIC